MPYHARAQFIERLTVGLQQSTDYSGCDMPRHASRFIIHAVAKMHPDKQVHWDLFRAGDCKQHCRAALLSFEMDPDLQTSCVFGDSHQRLPYTLLKMYSEKHRMMVRKCEGQQSDMRAAISHGWWQRMVKVFLDVEFEGAISDRIGHGGFCFSHSRWCTLELPPERQMPKALRINCAGVTCVDWSTYGLKKGVF